MSNTTSNVFVQMVQTASPDVNSQIAILLGLNPSVQGKTLMSLPPVEQRRIWSSLPHVERDNMWVRLSREEQTRFDQVLQPPPSHHVPFYSVVQNTEDQLDELAPIVHAELIHHPIPVGGGGEKWIADGSSQGPPSKVEPYKIYVGRLKGYLVRRVRKISPVVWVCEVLQVQHNPNQVNLTDIPRGVEVLVHTNDIHELTDADYAEIEQYYNCKEPAKNIQELKIGSWNIRCTGEFQNNDSFFPELLERFGRLAKFIVMSGCHVVGLQEFPMNFKHNENNLKIKAQLLLPEFVNKLNAECVDEEWDFGYSEDFPQECWKYYRKVKDKDGNLIEDYPPQNGEYIQAFVYKKKFIEMHSVEQVLDLNYQENRWKHAPIMGRFSFLRNFHFSLVNVHLRPFVAKGNAKFEIEDLGKCIQQLRKYNPKSTIILGDFNMAASRWALDERGLDRTRNTEFQPFVASRNVWESFSAEGYKHVVLNRHTNTSEDSPKQFDNIWLPKELYPKAIIKTTPVFPQNRAPYNQSDNVLRLQDVFVGTSGRQFIDKMTDHHLVYVDLEVDVSEDNDVIKTVFEIDNSFQGLSSREYNGFELPEEKKLKEPITPKLVDKSGPFKELGGPPSPLVPPIEDKVSLKDAKKHFFIWDKRVPEKKVTVDDMGGQEEKKHWANSLFHKKLEKPKGDKSWTRMKKLETTYFECKDRVKEVEAELDVLKSSSGDETEIKDNQKKLRTELKAVNFKMDNQILPEFERLVNVNFSEYMTAPMATGDGEGGVVGEGGEGGGSNESFETDPNKKHEDK